MLTLAGVSCVSLNGADLQVPDIAGTYATTISLAITNELEIRYDTLLATLRLRRGTNPGDFTGAYAIAPDDTGPFGGLLLPDGAVWLTTFGPTNRPLGGVSRIRSLYWWCDFSRLGSPLIRGALTGDSLGASVQGSLPCLYQREGGTLTLHTELAVELSGVRGLGTP